MAAPEVPAAQYDISDWTNGQTHEARDKRSHILDVILNNFKITGNQSKDHLRTILNSGWDVNETFLIQCSGDDKQLHKTALHMAAQRDCTEPVQMLLAAGATCKTSAVLQNPLVVVLENGSTDLLKLLLQHGADPNDHNGSFDNIPLLNAINYCMDNVVENVELLLEYGADPNVTAEHCSSKCSPLQLTLEAPDDLSAALFKSLLRLGADVNHTVDEKPSLLHEMIIASSSYPGDGSFLQDHLDLFFMHGGNIFLEDSDHMTALEYAVKENAHRNKVRWLIRHGADTSNMKVTLFIEHFTGFEYYSGPFPETPLILLQAGMRVSHGAQTMLSDVEEAIAKWLTEDTQDEENISVKIHGMLEELEVVEKEELQGNLQKSIFQEYYAHQMADLQEFSDESLQLYPEVCVLREEVSRQHLWQNTCRQIHRVVEFLRQTQSLQWYSRRCVRENLGSLQPSVVKKLPIPAKIKRYILCHEI